MKKTLFLFLLTYGIGFAQNDWEENNINKFLAPTSPLRYEDSSYMPLQIGNTYQFIESGFGMGTTWYYLRYVTISRDSLIDNQRYFLYTLNTTNHWFRYSESEKKLYEWYNTNEKLYMDFNKTPGDTFIHLNNTMPATVSGGDTNLFSMDFAFKGFSDPLIGATRNELFAKGLRLYYSGRESYYPTNSYQAFTLIMAKLIDSSGSIILFTNHYKPEITINPITTINTGNFSLGFKVKHKFDKPVPPNNTPMFFISSVQFDSYYSKNDSIVLMPLIDVTGITNYYVNTMVDTILMKNGFDFNYKIIAVDKGIIPETSFSPDTGYYKCVWSGPTEIDEQLINIPIEFRLEQNYPNPFSAKGGSTSGGNPSTKISWQSPVGNWQTLKVFDVLGREVATLVDEYRNAGSYEVEFSPINLPSGVYFYQLKAGEFVETKKMLFLK